MVLWLNKAIKYGTRGGAGPRLASLMFTRVNWFSIAGHVKLQALACHQSRKCLNSYQRVYKLAKIFQGKRLGDPTKEWTNWQKYFRGEGRGAQPESRQIGKKYFKGNRHSCSCAYALLPPSESCTSRNPIYIEK